MSEKAEITVCQAVVANPQHPHCSVQSSAGDGGGHGAGHSDDEEYHARKGSADVALEAEGSKRVVDKFEGLGICALIRDEILHQHAARGGVAPAARAHW